MQSRHLSMKCPLLAAFAAAALIPSTLGQTCLPPASGLIGWWPGEDSAADAVGPHDGTLQGNTHFVDGKIGRAFALNGQGDYVNLGAWTVGPAWTLEAWVNPSALPAGRHSILGSADECLDWSIALQDGVFGLVCKPPGGCSVTYLSGVHATTNTWYHVAGTCDGTNALLYVDGQLRISGPVQPNYVGTSLGLFIGGEVCCGGFYPGLIDSPAIYNRALNAAEVQSIYQAGAEPKCTNGIPPLVFASPPALNYVRPGSNVTLVASVAGSRPLSLEWYQDGKGVPSSSNALLTLSNLQTNQLGKYQLVARNASGTATSQVAQVLFASVQSFNLSVGDIVTNGLPAPGAGNIETPIGEDDYLFTGKAGQTVYVDELSSSPFVWSLLNPNGSAIISNDPLDGHNVGDRTMPLDGTYRIVVTDPVNETNAVGPYSFQLWSVPPPQQFALSVGQIVSDGIPSPGAGNIETPGVQDVYTFTATPGQVLYFRDLGATAPLDWALYDSAGNFHGVDRLDHQDPGNQTLTRGGQYRIVVSADNNGPYVGTYSFVLLSPAPIITAQPQNQVVVAGRPATFSVSVQSELPVTYQWLFNNRQIYGETNATLLVNEVGADQLGPYSVVVGNATSSVTSQPASLSLRPLIAQSAAARTALPAVPGNGVSIDLFNGIGGGGPPTPDLLQGRTPDGSTLSPVIDFPHPGVTINVGNDFTSFFQDTTTPPDQVRNLAAHNFVLRCQFYLRVSRDLDLNPATPEIDLQLGVGSDDGFALTVGTNLLGTSGDRAFTYTWMPVSFESEGLYPVTLLYDANAVGSSGLEFAWSTAGTNGTPIIPESALYITPNLGDRLITFEEVPSGTVLSNQFSAQGILFTNLAGQLQVTTNSPDRWVPVSPSHVFADSRSNPPDPGSVELDFVSPTNGAPAVTDFVSFFLINAQGPGATVLAYDGAGDVLYTNSFSAGGASQELVAISQPGIARVQINLGQGTNAAAIDNVSLTTPQSGPDLAVGSVIAPPNALPGGTATITWAVTNIGITTASGPWTEQVLLSNGQNGNSAVLGSFTQTDSLAPGAFLVRTQEVTVPISGPAGSLYFEVKVDAYNEVQELNEANNLAASPDPTDVPLWLSFDLSSTTTTEGDAPIQARLLRNGDLSAPLSITLTNDNPGQLSGPTNLVIAAGSAWVDFQLQGVADGVVDGTQVADLTASAPGYADTSASVTVYDADLPQLTMDLPSTPVLEGTVVQGLVSRPSGSTNELTVYVSSSDPTRVQTPNSVVIATNQTTASFQLVLVDDGLIGPTHTVSVVAQAPGYLDSPTMTLSILDNDLPKLTMSLSKQTVSEADGAEATVATVTRTPAGSFDLSLQVQSSNPQALQVPAQVLLPAGQSQITIPIAAVDDHIVEATRNVTITAVPVDAATGTQLGSGTSATVAVTDADGPNLQVSFARQLVGKGLNPATSATVTRSGALDQALPVALSSSDPSSATVPANITIPAGQASGSFNVVSLADSQPGTTKAVAVTATAPGFAPGNASFTISDVALPDLVVTNVSGPATADTEEFVGVTYRLVNQGLAPASTNILTRIFLSPDAVIGDDTLVGDFSFTGTIPPGEFFEQTLQIRMPTVPGDYWVVVTADVDNRVPEILEDNNTTISAVPIHVREAYTATATTTTTVTTTGTPIVFTGRALKADSNVPAPQVPVHLHLLVRDTRRVLLAVTDDNGNFSVTFNPLPNEAGSYGYAAAHPGESDPAIQGHFTILGMLAQPPQTPVPLIEQVSTNLNLSLENLSDQPLTGLQVGVTNQPQNVSVTASVQSGQLAGSGSAILSVLLTASDASIPQGTVNLHITSQEGAAADVAIPITVESLQPRLVFSPSQVVAGMKPGSQAFAEFEIANLGGASTGPISVLTPNLPWLHVTSANPLAPIAPGETNRVTVQLLPAPDLALGNYTGAFVLRAGDQSISVPFTFRALSEAKGDLRVTAVDEYTYYADGAPPVTNATVTVRDSVSGNVLTNGVTDANGQFVVPQLFEGYYDIQVDADSHIGYRGTSLVQAGVTNDVQAFLSRQTVRYTWTVVPTQIEDRTTISIQTEFETFVPIPVVTIDPPVIDLSTLTADVTQIDLQIANHGLIAANDFKLGFSSHPDWQLEPLVTEIGALPARSSMVVPLTIRRLKAGPQVRRPGPLAASVAPASAAPCGISGGGSWDIVCGTVKHYSTPVLVLNAGGNCGGGAAGGAWGGTGSPAAPFVSGPSFPITSNCSTNKCLELNLPQVDLGFILKPLAKAGAAAINAYLDKQLWNFFLGLEAEIDPEVKGKIGVCCTNNTPKYVFSATLGGEIKLKSGKRNVNLKTSQTIPEFDLAGQSGQLGLDLNLFLGTTAVPSFKISGTYKQDCGDNKPVYEVEIVGGVTVKSGLEGTAKAQFIVNRKTLKQATGLEVKGGIQGAIRFTYTWSSDGKNQFCYDSDGLYLYGSGPIFGQNSDWFAGGKYYLIQPQKDCTGAPGPENLAEINAMLASMAEQYAQQHTEQHAESPAPPQPKASEGGGVCARVRLQLDQDLILTRNAFNATLELVNNDPATPLEDISVQVNPLTTAGDSAADLFEISTNQLNGITAVDGTGTVNPSSTGTASWIIVPTTDAAPDAPTNYQVSGVLSYRQGDQHIVVPLSAVPITVQPDPRLQVKYFHQRDVFADDPFTPIVEPSIPFSLAVMIQNTGQGVANNVQITSAQPQIIDNEKGLLIDFKIIGTEVAGQPATPSLTADFGTINPGDIVIGRWLMTSTLQGLFEDYQATIEHTAGPFDQRTALVDDVSIHEMIHLVQAPGKLDDGKPDFLVNDVPDPQALPDTLYLSDGSTNDVAVVQDASVQGQLAANNLSIQLIASVPPEWVYLQVPDPGNGQFKLQRVVRSDGVEIAFGTNVWTTDRTFIGQGRRPIDENLIHLLDYNSTGSYTLYYEPTPPLESIPPVSKVDPLPANSYTEIPLTWSGQDNPGGSGVDYYDIYVSVNGGAFTPWLQKTDLTGAVYDGTLSNSYAFYSVATDNAGNREAAHTSPDAQTTVTRVNHAPVLTAIPNQSVLEGNVLVINPTATDPDAGDVLTWSFVGNTPAGLQINPQSGQITWNVTEGLGPSTNRLTVQVLDNGIPRLGSLSTFNVVIVDQNQAPELQPLPSQTIREGQLLTLTNVAVDPDWPPQQLTFRFGNSSPAGAALDPNTGVFTWRPDNTQGGTNYLVSIIVSDNGVPSLSATQALAITVLDTSSDFTLQLGSTNVLAGASGTLPIALKSSANLTNVTFDLHLSDVRLSQLSLQPLVPQLSGASIVSQAPNSAAVQLSAAANNSLAGNQVIAQLHFTADTNQHSEIVSLSPDGVNAIQAGGRELTNGLAEGGRVFLIGTEPLLDISSVTGGAAQLVLFGPSGNSYQIQFKTNLVNGSDWAPLGSYTLTTPYLPFTALGAGPEGFYRALQLTGAGPHLMLIPSANGSWGLYLSATPGQAYIIDSRSLTPGAVWVPGTVFQVTNALQNLGPLVSPGPGRLFRARGAGPE
jgi:hypothetical protein